MVAHQRHGFAASSRPRAWMSWVMGVCALLGALLPAELAAQTDPCLEELAADEAKLAAYDRQVSSYLDARDEGDPRRQVEALDVLLELCDANLRLLVFRGDALREAGSCEDAANAYLTVLDRAPTWPHPANAKDAAERARERLETVTSCVATVHFACATPQSTLKVGSQAARGCDDAILVSPGTYQVVAEAEGFAPLTKAYTFSAGAVHVEVPALREAEGVGQVEFVCSDEGVEIEISGHRYPCNTKVALSPGARSYTARYSVGAPYTGMVRADAGQTVREQIPSSGGGVGFGNLQVTCTPVGAKVVLVAKRQSVRRSLVCPGEQAIEAGTYALTAKLDGYQPYEQDLEVPAGSAVAVDVAFTKEKETWFEVQAGVGYGYASSYSNNESAELGALLADLEGTFYAVKTNYFFGGGVQLALGDATGVLALGRFGARWEYDAAALYYTVGLGYGTMGIPACAPGDCEDEEEAAGLAYVLGGGLHLRLTEAFALAVGFDLVSDFSVKTSIRIASGVVARF